MQLTKDPIVQCKLEGFMINIRSHTEESPWDKNVLYKPSENIWKPKDVDICQDVECVIAGEYKHQMMKIPFQTPYFSINI